MKKSHEFANPSNPEFRIKGQDFLLRTAAFELITNAVEEALDYNHDKGAAVSVRLCDGNLYSFLDDSFYLMVADNGRGIDIGEYFGSETPDAETKGNHLYHMGVIRALSKFDPHEGRIVIFTREESGLIRYDCNIKGGSRYDESKNAKLSAELPEGFNSYVFARIDVNENNLSELRDFQERLRTKYHYYLVGGKERLFLTWNGKQIKPLTFTTTKNNGYKKWSEDFGDFVLEIERFQAPPSRKGKGEFGVRTRQPKYKGFSGRGGVAIYRENLFIQDARFLCLFPGLSAMNIYGYVKKAADERKISEREALFSNGLDILEAFWWPDTNNLPVDGIDRNNEYMDRLRYLVNVRTKNGFVLDTQTTKTCFLWNRELEKVMLAIDSLIGDEVRGFIRTNKEAEMRITAGGLLNLMSWITKRGPFKALPPAPGPICFRDGAWESYNADCEHTAPDAIVEYRAETYEEADAERTVQYHTAIVNAHKSELPVENGKLRTPSLCIAFSGYCFAKEAYNLLREYKRRLLKEDLLVDIKVYSVIFDEDYDDVDDDEKVKEFVIEL